VIAFFLIVQLDTQRPVAYYVVIGGDMFSEALKNTRKLNKMSQEDLASAIAILTGDSLTRQAVQRWESGVSAPEQDKWAAIEKALGQPEGWVFALISADTRQHNSSISMRDANRSPASAINAQNVGSIQISADDNLSNGQQPGHHEILSDVEYEVLVLFRKYGNPALLQRCLGQLRQAQEIFG
jgi:transcriptional regulator with XRE-family HTH domain